MSTSTQQKSRRYLYLVIIVVLAIIFAIYFCNKPKIPNDPIKAPAAFAFIDANVVNNSYVPDVKVTLIDPNGDVRTSSGTSFTELTLKNGVMNLGLDYQAAVNEKEPYRYRIKAEAPGYVTTMETVFLTDEKSGYYPIFMVKLESPPPGISKVMEALSVNKNGYVTSDRNIVTTGGSDDQLRFTLSIPEGTQLLSNCKEISNPDGDARIQLAFSDPSAPNAGRTFPNGFLVTDAIDMKGDTIARPSDPGFFASAGWLSASIQVGDQEVTDFSKPVEGTIGISSELVNPETQDKFKEGDTLPIWSLDGNFGNWRLEEEAIVQENLDGDLFVTFPMSHLSIWNLDMWAVKCEADIIFQVDNQGCARSLNVEISSDDTGEIYTPTGIPGTSDGIGFFPEGISSHTIQRSPQGIPLKIKIYDYAPIPTKLGESDPITNCNVPLPSLPPPPPISTINLAEGLSTTYVNLEVTINGNIMCNNAIWYQECPEASETDCINWMVNNTDPWHYAGVLIDGKLTTLEINPSTDTNYLSFQVWYHDPSTDGKDSIKFLLDQNPFSVDQFCQTWSGGNSITSYVEPIEVTVDVAKTCSRPLPDGTGHNCPTNTATCNNCPGSNELSVTIQISNAPPQAISSCSDTGA